jgi:integrase
MARSVRAPKLETRTSRLKLAVRKKPYFVTISPRIALGYRRNAIAGSWSVRASDGHGGNWLKQFALADDHESSNGESVLDFWQAQDKARLIARVGEGSSGERPATVGEALDAYEVDLRARGGALGNVGRVRFNVPNTLASRPVTLLTAKELRAWRDRLVKNGMAPASADRTARALAAALSLAAKDDPRIINAAAWKTGLARLPDAEQSRHDVILTDRAVRAVVVAAYGIDQAFGLFVELAAVTGARASQLLRVEVCDLQDGTAPRLLVPTSRKGRRRQTERRPLPIPPTLAQALRRAALDRPRNTPLLLRADGSRWPALDLVMFRRAAKQAGLDPDVTPYSLRHSSIVRQLIAGVPLRLVAAGHDTSTAIIERNYSRHIIGDPSDALTRRAMLDLAMPEPADNVVPIAGR